MTLKSVNCLRRPALHFRSLAIPLRQSPIKSCIAQYSSHSPMGSTTASTRKKVTIQTIQNLYKKNEPITVLTASDFPSGHVADTAGMEIVLVGDSLAMVAMGMEDTNEVTMDEMLLHCRSVNRAVKSAFTVSTAHMHAYMHTCIPYPIPNTYYIHPTPPHQNTSSHNPYRLQTYQWAHTKQPQKKP